MRYTTVLGTLFFGCFSPILFTACTSSGNASDGGGDGGTNTDTQRTDTLMLPEVNVVPGQVNLQAGEAREQSAGYSVNISISNGTSNSIAVSPLVFKMLTDDGLETTATVNSIDSRIPGICPSDRTLAPNGTLSCLLYFENITRTPTKIVYTGTGTRVESNTLTVSACTRCQSSCTDLDNDYNNCGSCGNVVPGLRWESNGTHNPTRYTCTEGAIACTEGYGSVDDFCVTAGNVDNTIVFNTGFSTLCEERCASRGGCIEAIYKIQCSTPELQNIASTAMAPDSEATCNGEFDGFNITDATAFGCTIQTGVCVCNN